MRYRACYFPLSDTYDEKFNKASQNRKNRRFHFATTALPQYTKWLQKVSS